MNTIIKIFASGFGSGYFPIASGTWGSLFAALIYWYLFPHNNYFSLLIVVFSTIISVPISTMAEKLYQKKDDSHIVIDEFIGMWISLLFLPHTLFVYFTAFILFRIFDVIKPFFIRKVQSWNGGLGIVADDFFAGIFVNLIMQILVFFYCHG